MAWWNDPDDEDEVAERYIVERRKMDRYIRQYESTPQVARRMSKWADYAPFLPMGVVTSFAKADVDPESRLGKWVIKSASVALDARQSAKRSEERSTYAQTRPMLRFLQNQGIAESLSELDPRAVRDLERRSEQGGEVFTFTNKELSRLAQHKDPTPEPGGLGGVFHDIGDVATTGSRYTFGGLQAGSEAVSAGFRGVVSGVAGLANPQQREAALDVASGQAGMQQRAQTPDVTKFGNIEIANDPDVLFSPKQITLYNMLKGEGSGSGIFPMGEAHETQIEAARAAGSVRLPNGERSALTPGRFSAALVVEPDTIPYNIMSGLVDAAVALKADPSNIALAKYADVKAARKLFTPEAAGAYTGLRKVFHGPTASQWLDSIPGKYVQRQIARTDSLRTLRERLGKEFPGELLAPLQEAKTVDEVANVIKPALAGGQTRRIPTWGFDWRHTADSVRLTKLAERIPKKGNARWLETMPRGEVLIRGDFRKQFEFQMLHNTDVNNNLEQLERLGKQWKFPEEDLERHMSRMARTTGRADLADLMFHDVTETMAKQAAKYDMPEDQFKKLSSFFRTENETVRELANDQLGELLSMETPWVAGDEAWKIVGPHNESELLNSGIMMPDIESLRAIRHRISALSKVPFLGEHVWNSKFVGGATAVGDAFMGEVWKPLALIRIAWTLRVIGEEQVRMSADGLDGMFNHPARAVGWVTGRKGGGGMKGLKFADEAQATQGGDMIWQQARAGYGDATVNVGRPDRHIHANWGKFARGSTPYKPVWEKEITHMASAPVNREVARALRDPTYVPKGATRPGIAGVKESYWSGGLAPIREEMRRANLWTDSKGAGRSSTLLADPRGSDAFIDSTVKRIQGLTGHDETLLDTIAHGKGINWSGNGPAITDELGTHLDDLISKGTGPEMIRGYDPAIIEQKRGWWDRATRYAFNALMTVPTNKLSRSPVFNQKYWIYGERLLPYMDEASQTTAIANAAKYKINLKKPAISGDMSLDTADFFSKGYALDETRQLLYDVTQKSNSWDAMRLIFPFGEAFKEVTTRWATLIAENPRLLRRFQQGVYGARGADPLNTGQGFFYTDPNDGQEYFNFPFSGHAARAFSNTIGKLPGALGEIPGVGGALEGATEPFLGELPPWMMRGRVASLNIAGQGLPAVGPGVSMLVSDMLPYEARWDWIRSYVDPYGDPESDVFDRFFPGYAKRLKGAGWLEPFGLGPSAGQERVFDNSVKNMYQYVISTGQYDVLNPDKVREESARAMEDAKDMAKRLSFWQGVMQSAAPAAPQPIPTMKGEDGALYEIYEIAKDYYSMREANGGDTVAADMEFVEKYGATSYFALEPRGMREVYGVPTTHQAELWREEHKGFAAEHPNVYGYFAPQGGDFDYTAYTRAVARGEISTLSPDEWVQRANDRIGSSLAALNRSKLGANPTEEQLNHQAEYQAKLKRVLPGYDPEDLGFGGASRDLRIVELESAIKHKDVRNTPMAKATGAYMKARNEALDAMAAGRGTTRERVTWSAKYAKPYREWLRNYADKLIRSEPEWTAIYDGIFSGEVRITDEELEDTG